ncbi:Glycosyltransferase [Cupriavidus necator]|uniref:Glycosyltransferase family 1 protein n=1 Tax=Cupriavidus necator (strain ATCC 17699 / DSM 428 / KCTC 22496 / NCIMB 10442 / H16 / Stanier 337) TaxID=381666 RepID=Q0K7Q6_CUPNH|nr:glycosyltransferase family 4 protein [Cupriavidus necator]QCC01735.1 glycosyltransferase family 1 protein [Cupriavidus necator H16]QQB75434.1 glycosyltransferase family 4 protein [Cupriavidus necator]WKA40133.1 glycosyltransferase family 4 protein [Cupriavidus necator]CAJ93965.1 Glycosyltransferase, probably involved in lipopolysaccharide biosynthesis [Cupriavidus necator H16]
MLNSIDEHPAHAVSKRFEEVAHQPGKLHLDGIHIAFVGNSSWSIQQYRGGVVRALLAHGAKVSIIAPVDRSSEALQALGCEFHPLTLSARSANPLADWKCFSQLTRLYRQLKPDCAFQYTIKPNIYGSLAARLSGVPCIAVTTGLGFVFINNNFVARIGRALYRLALRSVHQVWFLNEDDRREFVKRSLVSEQRTFVLPSEGIDLEHYTPGERQPRENNTFRFLLIARMLWDKGVGEYVEAARRIRAVYPTARFQLLGPADVENPSAISRTQLLAWQDEGLIEYLGTATDVRGAIAQADCIVLPSYREGVPRTLLEAASMEKPIVATDVPGCRDVVRDRVTGRLCRPRSAEDLSQTMLELCQSEEETLRQMGKAGRLDVDARFSEGRVIDIYMKAIALIRRRKSA